MQQRGSLRFENAIKSEETRKVYTHQLKKFVEFCQLNYEDLSQLRDADGLLQLSDSYLQELLEDYLFLLKTKLNPNSIPVTFAPLELFFAINDKTLNFKKLHKMYPAKIKRTGQRAYTTEQIREMLRVAQSLRLIALIHFMASTGCRKGALRELKLKHLIKIGDCYRVILYEGATEEYIGFLTPEATKALDSYLEKRKRDGEILSDDSTVFREAYRMARAKPKQLGTDMIQKIMDRIIKKAGIQRAKYGKRYDTQIDHGFRKRFDTILKNNRQGNISLKEKLMGHSTRLIPLDTVYHDPDMHTLFEEFKLHIHNLTIDGSERLKIENQKLEAEKSDLEKKTTKIAELEEILSKVIHKLDIMEQTAEKNNNLS